MTLQDRSRELQQRAKVLDDRYVPVLAARARTWAERTFAALQGARLRREQLAHTRPAELDARFADNSLLKAVREIPQLGFVIVAAVFLAGTTTALLSQQPSASRGTDRPAFEQPVPEAGIRLGPDIGETTTGYEASALQDLERLAATAPTDTRLALVTFSGYRSPGQVEALLTSYHVRRVYLRAKAGGPNAVQLPYEIRGELGGSLRKAYADVALSRLAVRRSYLAYVATTTDDKAYQDDYAAFAESTGREVVAYQHNCACIFTAVVEAPARDLLALRGHAEVRAVQAAGKGLAIAALIVQPLLPETTGLVVKGPVGQQP